LLNGIAINIADSHLAMAQQSAAGIADELRSCLRRQPGIRMVAAPSQAEMLAALREEKNIDWTRVTAMDEYMGLPPSPRHLRITCHLQPCI